MALIAAGNFEESDETANAPSATVMTTSPRIPKIQAAPKLVVDTAKRAMDWTKAPAAQAAALYRDAVASVDATDRLLNPTA
jgi:hypothetical protein